MNSRWDCAYCGAHDRADYPRHQQCPQTGQWETDYVCLDCHVNASGRDDGLRWLDTDPRKLTRRQRAFWRVANNPLRSQTEVEPMHGRRWEHFENAEVAK